MLNGQTIPGSGRINLLGQDTAGKNRARSGLGVGRTFQITATFPTMTVREKRSGRAGVVGRQLFTSGPRRHGSQGRRPVVCWNSSDERLQTSLR